MSKQERKDCPRGQKEDDCSSENAARGEDRATRTPAGRFAPGHCPNPKGRPRKQAAGLVDVVTRVLEEKIQDNTPGSSKCMSVSEALVRSLCAKALKDERVALALLKLVISSPQAAKSNDEQVFEEDEEGVLARFVERELRQRALREAAAKDTNAGMGEDGAEGS